MHLLTFGNPKTLKGVCKGYTTAILHLAPSTLSGFNACPMASIGCANGCLNTAGRGGMFKAGENTNAIQEARIRRTRQFFTDRDYFLTLLVQDVRQVIHKAKADGLTPVFRLNGTSDIRWETVKITEGHVTWRSIMHMFPEVQFYDYTKIPNRVNIPDNYHLTFSLSESNFSEAMKQFGYGRNVAVVFDVVPDRWQNVPVINGDEHDLRFLDPVGVVVGLKAKGRARKDTSGFVQRLT